MGFVGRRQISSHFSRIQAMGEGPERLSIGVERRRRTAFCSRYVTYSDSFFTLQRRVAGGRRSGLLARAPTAFPAFRPRNGSFRPGRVVGLGRGQGDAPSRLSSVRPVGQAVASRTVVRSLDTSTDSAFVTPTVTRLPGPALPLKTTSICLTKSCPGTSASVALPHWPSLTMSPVRTTASDGGSKARGSLSLY